ncbi:TIGR02679 family protein [Radiobacillus sp. PE A8.2]|uniref:TIGR02679 family protein n=1 Tax=Radiobacillus sp. PE A8.2 TaxID=3380349 RepID=UPI00388EA187
MINQALDYFSGDAGHRRLFLLFKKKYQSLGRIGGTVNITGFHEQELATIASFFGITQSELKQNGKVALEQFQQQLQRTKFEGIGLKELLEAHFGETLISNKQAKQLKEQQQVALLEQLQRDFPALSFWFSHLLAKTADSYWIYRLVEDSDQTFIQMTEQLHKAISQLPDRLERLPMFSQRITRNPHAFDRNTNLGKLWIHVLAVDRGFDEKLIVPADSEGMNELLLHYWILRDDITNFVTCANLLAESANEADPLWVAAAKKQSVMNVPLRELVKLDRIYPSNHKQKVWIVENSGVYSSILDEVPHAPLVCTHGQFKLAALMLMDMLVKENCYLYYAGDLDPEGLGMAARLLQRYPDHVKLWHMDVAAYHTTKADVTLSQERLNKLASINVDCLRPVVEAIKRTKKAGYQEALVDKMIAGLRSEK